MNWATSSPTRATTPRGTRLRVLVEWTEKRYEGAGTLVAWPPGRVPRIRLDSGALVLGCECWWAWMERGKRRAMPRRTTVRRGHA